MHVCLWYIFIKYLTNKRLLVEQRDRNGKKWKEREKNTLHPLVMMEPLCTVANGVQAPEKLTADKKTAL